jgi:HJR/Mrr/RecB family endonuclease
LIFKQGSCYLSKLLYAELKNDNAVNSGNVHFSSTGTQVKKSQRTVKSSSDAMRLVDEYEFRATGAFISWH